MLFTQCSCRRVTLSRRIFASAHHRCASVVPRHRAALLHRIVVPSPCSRRIASLRHRVAALSRHVVASHRRAVVASCCRVVALLRRRRCAVSSRYCAASSHRIIVPSSGRIIMPLSTCSRCIIALYRHRCRAASSRHHAASLRRRQLPHCFWLVVVFGCRAVAVCVVASRHRVASTVVAPSSRCRFWLVVALLLLLSLLLLTWGD
jgi:hypothetical protein